jgi:hypothetical protein
MIYKYVHGLANLGCQVAMVPRNFVVVPIIFKSNYFVVCLFFLFFFLNFSLTVIAPQNFLSQAVNNLIVNDRF